MTSPDGLREVLQAALGVAISDVRSLGGGDVARAWGADASDGRRLFVKTRSGASVRDFEVEAKGLVWLAEAHAIRVPQVVAFGGPPAFLALERIELGAAGRGHDEALGRGLAALHRHGADRFGLDHDNLIGPLPQPNAQCDDWPTFYGQRRLLPFAERAAVPADVMRDLQRIVARLPALCGDGEPPARLHGDLWAGNAIVDATGDPVLVDPAVYGGHREIDLAMMRLFGGFSARTFAAYDEAWPLLPGWRDRVPLYQLYPLLVHCCLFGRSYLGRLREAIAAVS